MLELGVANLSECPAGGKLLSVFLNETRIEILNLLLEKQWMNPKMIEEKLISEYNRKISTTGLLKHLKKLEQYGILKSQYGLDARKRMFKIIERNRVKMVLNILETEVILRLEAGLLAKRIADLSLEIQRLSPVPRRKKIMLLKSLISRFDDSDLKRYLEKDERKKINLAQHVIMFYTEP